MALSSGIGMEGLEAAYCIPVDEGYQGMHCKHLGGLAGGGQGPYSSELHQEEKPVHNCQNRALCVKPCGAAPVKIAAGAAVGPIPMEIEECESLKQFVLEGSDWQASSRLHWLNSVNHVRRPSHTTSVAEQWSHRSAIPHSAQAEQTADRRPSRGGVTCPIDWEAEEYDDAAQQQQGSKKYPVQTLYSCRTLDPEHSHSTQSLKKDSLTDNRGADSNPGLPVVNWHQICR